VNLLQLGEDEFAPHVCHLHLQLVDLKNLRRFKLQTLLCTKRRLRKRQNWSFKKILICLFTFYTFKTKLTYFS
jgi:hypothetical protein